MALDGNGNEWFGTNSAATNAVNGITKFNGSTWSENLTDANCPLPNGLINVIAIDGLGNKWFGTQNGLFEYSGN